MLCLRRNLLIDWFTVGRRVLIRYRKRGAESARSLWKLFLRIGQLTVRVLGQKETGGCWTYSALTCWWRFLVGRVHMTA